MIRRNDERSVEPQKEPHPKLSQPRGVSGPKIEHSAQLGEAGDHGTY